MRIAVVRALSAASLSMCLATGCALLSAGDYASRAFMRESDPALAEDAFPTMIKAAEAIQLANPGNRDDATLVASLYVMYANAFLEGKAFLLPDEAFEERLALAGRANALYLRAAALLAPFIEAAAPGALGSAVGPDDLSLSRLGRKDVPTLYWTSAAILAAFASDPMDFENAARVSGAMVLFERARSIEPDWNGGALHELAITLYGSLPADLGGDRSKAREAFELAKSATGASSPGAFVAYASSVCVPEGDADGFEQALETALGLPDRPESALMDAIARRKARRLLDDEELYFYLGDI